MVISFWMECRERFTPGQSQQTKIETLKLLTPIRTIMDMSTYNFKEHLL